MRKDRRDLERPHEAHAGDLGGFDLGDVLILQMIRPRVGLQELRQQIEDGGLAGAVGADQRVDRALADVKIHAFDGREAGEFLVRPRAENTTRGWSL